MVSTYLCTSTYGDFNFPTAQAARPPPPHEAAGGTRPPGVAASSDTPAPGEDVCFPGSEAG